VTADSRVLVVDDSEESRQILSEILRTKGYTVNTAPDGESAWTLLQQSRFSYELVITDLMMPWMSGVELLRKIRADSPWINVVLLTGHLDHEVTLRAQRLGAFAVLSKPCDIAKLEGIVERALLKSALAKGGDSHEKVSSRCDGPSDFYHDL